MRHAVRHVGERDVDEDDAAAEHDDAQRHMRRKDQDAGDQRRAEDVEREGAHGRSPCPME